MSQFSFLCHLGVRFTEPYSNKERNLSTLITPFRVHFWGALTSMHTTLVCEWPPLPPRSWVLSTKFCNYRAYLSKLTPVNPCMTFDLINTQHFSQWFPLQNLVATGHSWAIWPLVDLSWSLHDLWPHQFILLQSEHGFFLPAKFSLSQDIPEGFDPSWPLHDLWPHQCPTL